jgi:hypothetical protein
MAQQLQQENINDQGREAEGIPLQLCSHFPQRAPDRLMENKAHSSWLETAGTITAALGKRRICPYPHQVVYFEEYD